MNDNKSRDNQIGFAIGGCSMLGLGIGLFFFPAGVFGVTSVFAFVGCLMGGCGIGLLVAAVLSNKRI
jgi:hypothetical protein